LKGEINSFIVPRKDFSILLAREPSNNPEAKKFYFDVNSIRIYLIILLTPRGVFQLLQHLGTERYGALYRGLRRWPYETPLSVALRQHPRSAYDFSLTSKPKQVVT
jgi:hypothetical protein